MYRIDTNDAVSKLPEPGAPGEKPNSYFTNGDPRIGVPGTILQADWANAVQEELCTFIQNSGIKLDKKSSTQLNDLLQAKTSFNAAATVPLGSIPARFIDLTGNTTIISFGLPTGDKNTSRVIRFMGSLTLTHNPINLILPGGQNIQTAIGDIAEFYHLGSGNWLCMRYEKASGAPIIPTVGFFAHLNGIGQEIQPGMRGTPVRFNTCVFNENECYDVNTYKFTPKISGKYLVISQLHFNYRGDPPLTQTNIHSFIYCNNHRSYLTVLPTGQNFAHLTLSTIIHMNEKDFLYCVVEYTAGHPIAYIEGFPESSFFTAMKIN